MGMNANMGYRLKLIEFEAVRKSTGFSQAEIAKKAGIVPATICGWKKGTYASPKSARKIVAALSRASGRDCFLGDIFFV